MAKTKKASKNRVKTTRPLPTPNVTARHIGATTADVSDYVRAKTAAGNVSLHSGDATAKSLAGKPIDDAYAAAAKATDQSVRGLKARYGHLNLGMQRMSLGNLIRGATRAAARE